MSTSPASQHEFYPIGHTLLAESIKEPASLVEQTRREVEDELIGLFTDQSSPPAFRFYEVAEMLRSERRPLIYAMEEMELLPRKPFHYEWTPQRVQDQVKEISQRDIIKLNNHHYTRTVSSKGLTNQLKSFGEPNERSITEIAQSLNIVPVKTWKTVRHGKQSFKGYFDLDQIELLKRALSGDTIPKQQTTSTEADVIFIGRDSEEGGSVQQETSDHHGLIAANTLMTRLGMTPEELRPFEEITGTEPHYIARQEGEEGAAFYTKKQAGKILYAIKRNIDRKRNK